MSIFSTLLNLIYVFIVEIVSKVNEAKALITLFWHAV